VSPRRGCAAACIPPQGARYNRASARLGARLRFDARKLRDLRLRKGWTLAALSVRSCVSERAIQDLETSTTQRPRPNTVRWLAEALEELPKVLWVDDENAAAGPESPGTPATVLVHDEEGHLLNRVGIAHEAVHIGRDARNDIVLPSPLVSLFHALVTRRNGSLELRDLGSSNGTYVRGRSVARSHRLAFGESVAIGPFVLEVRHPTETSAVPIETLRLPLEGKLESEG